MLHTSVSPVQTLHSSFTVFQHLNHSCKLCLEYDMSICALNLYWFMSY